MADALDRVRVRARARALLAAPALVFVLLLLLQERVVHAAFTVGDTASSSFIDHDGT